MLDNTCSYVYKDKQMLLKMYCNWTDLKVIWDNGLGKWKQSCRPQSCPVTWSICWLKDTSFPTQCSLDLSGIWHILLKVDTGKCLHRVSSAEQPAEVSHFVRVLPCPHVSLCVHDYTGGYQLMKLMLKMKQNPRRLHDNNTSAHFRTFTKYTYSSDYFSSLHYNIIVFYILAYHFQWLWKECITSVV